MSRYYCNEHPETLVLASEVVEARPGAVRLAQHPFYPGGGGQLPDRGLLRWSGGESTLKGIETFAGKQWLLLADPTLEISGAVESQVDAGFRRMMRELHTDLHIVNALVYQAFDGALVTSAQMNDDGTARVDFDLPNADNDRLRALEPAINDIIRQNLAVRDSYMAMDDAVAEKGLLRSRSVAPPPTADGQVRIVEIVGLDRQACGGTHVSATGQSRPVKILKIDNKGRHNRRVKIGLAV
jgi:misacylated tRNA(Ala) deacylase